MTEPTQSTEPMPIPDRAPVEEESAPPPPPVKKAGTVTKTPTAAEKERLRNAKKQGQMQKKIDDLKAQIVGVKEQQETQRRDFDKQIDRHKKHYEVMVNAIVFGLKLEAECGKGIAEHKTAIKDLEKMIAETLEKREENEGKKKELLAKVEEISRERGAAVGNFDPHLAALHKDMERFERRLQAQRARHGSPE